MKKLDYKAPLTRSYTMVYPPLICASPATTGTGSDFEDPDSTNTDPDPEPRPGGRGAKPVIIDDLDGDTLQWREEKN